MAAVALQQPRRTFQEWTYRNRDKLLSALAFVSIFVVIAPALWLILTSFKTSDNIFRFPPQLIPNPFTFENYTTALSGGQFSRYLLNSLTVTGISTGLCVLFSALAAYALTFFKFVGRRVCLAVIVGSWGCSTPTSR
jgi:ABC-type glycerol-3-phosphate transport system permease component